MITTDPDIFLATRASPPLSLYIKKTPGKNLHFQEKISDELLAICQKLMVVSRHRVIAL